MKTILIYLHKFTAVLYPFISPSALSWSIMTAMPSACLGKADKTSDNDVKVVKLVKRMGRDVKRWFETWRNCGARLRFSRATCHTKRSVSKKQDLSLTCRWSSSLILALSNALVNQVQEVIFIPTLEDFVKGKEERFCPKVIPGESA